MSHQQTERYSHGYDDSVLDSYRQRTAANSAAYLIPVLQDGMCVLDVGCGPGSISADFAACLPQGQVIGIDVSRESIAQAQAQYACDHLHFLTGSVYALPFADDYFDVVHAHQVLQHLANPIAALLEMKRVLKPNGLLALRDTTYASMSWAPRLPELDTWMAIYQALVKHNGGNPNIGEELAALCAQTQWQHMEVSIAKWHFHAQDGTAAWWGDSWRQRTLQSDFAKQAVAFGFATHEVLNDISRAWHTWGQHPQAQFTMTHHQILARKETSVL